MRSGRFALTERCPKTATYRSRRFLEWQPDAVGRHDLNLKIDVGNSACPVGFVGLQSGRSGNAPTKAAKK
jgi:hypothetical protein